VIEKAPLFALALASCVVTFVVQKSSGAVESLDAYPLGVRLANALVACVGYLIKAVWPARLACFYAHPGASLPIWQTVGSGLVLVAATVLAARAARTRPYLIVGWLWYLITLLPVIGIVQVGKQAMADRYTYIPLVGIFIALVWGAGDLARERVGRSRAIVGLKAALAMCALTALTATAYRQIGYWRNDPSIWTRAIAVTRDNAIAHYNLGTTLAVQGDDEGAIRHFAASVRIDPRKFDAHANLGAMLLQRGRLDEGIKHLRIAIRLKPDDYQAQSNLGLVLVQQGKFAEAVPHLRIALKIKPEDAELREALAAAVEHRE
jgi:tetratricopeptide (TPR) repeat protein